MTEQYVDPKPLSDQEVVAAYERQELDGEEVMVRLLRRVGLEHRGYEPMVDNGTVLTGEDGKVLRAVDYLSIAGEKARAMILKFVSMDTDHPQYPMVCKMIQATVNDRLPPEKAAGSE
jgi:hypothetical protein